MNKGKNRFNNYSQARIHVFKNKKANLKPSEILIVDKMMSPKNFQKIEQIRIKVKNQKRKIYKMRSGSHFTISSH